MQVPEGSEGRLLHRDGEQGAGVVAMQRSLGGGAGSVSGLGSKTVTRGRMRKFTVFVPPTQIYWCK